MKKITFIFLFIVFLPLAPALADDGGFGDNYFANTEYAGFSNPESKPQLLAQDSFSPEDLNALEPATGTEESMETEKNQPEISK
jgi:hypothetical protein